MLLSFREYGDGPPVILVHGLLGSGTSMGLVARALGERFRVIVPDLRNHGRSFHHRAMTYRDMALDLAGLMDELGIETVGIAGHSMGGKCAMRLALDHPGRVGRLAVLDMAPKAYPCAWAPWIRALLDLDLSGIKKRADADRMLSPFVPERDFRQFLLQNLGAGKGGFYWRSNLSGILAAMDDICSRISGPPYPKEALFIRGGDSDYILDDDWQDIAQLFPGARLQTVMGADHLVHFTFRELIAELLSDFFRPA